MPSLITLPSGRILSVGGYNQASNSSIAEAAIYDEAGGSWARIADLAEGRFAHTTTLLRDGSVLVAGGDVQSTGAEAKTCELGAPAVE